MFSPYVSGTASILLGLVPLSILNFIIKWSSVKSAIKTFKRNMKKHLKKGSSIESSETAPTSFDLRKITEPKIMHCTQQT